jgi:nitrite reductase (cytochrome c-552)
MADETRSSHWLRSRGVFGALIALVTALTVGLTALLMNIAERKAEHRQPFVRVVEVTEDDTDPAQWGKNWPSEYDGYKRTALHTGTRFGGHAGSEALPPEKIERDPWLARMFKGYAFSIDYRDRRGHAFMLTDQEATKRLTKPQSGSCLHCHASILPLYRQLGGGDVMAGFEESYGACASGELRGLPRSSGHGAARDAPRLHPRDPSASCFRGARSRFAVRGALATGQTQYALQPERGCHAQ